MKANKKTVKPWTAKEKDDLGTANRVMPVNWNWLPFGFTLIFFCPVPHRVESKWNGFDRQNEIGGWEQCVNRAAICSGVCVCVCVCVTCVYPVSYLYRTACRRVCSEKKKKWRSGRISEYPPGFDGNKKKSARRLEPPRGQPMACKWNANGAPGAPDPHRWWNRIANRLHLADRMTIDMVSAPALRFVPAPFFFWFQPFFLPFFIRLLVFLNFFSMVWLVLWFFYISFTFSISVLFTWYVFCCTLLIIHVNL